MNKDLSEYSMQELFCLELENQTGVLSQGLIGLEDTPYSKSNMEKLMRASHSIKGAARIIGLDELVNIAHKMEDCFVVAMKDRTQLSSESIDVLLQAVDLMNLVSDSQDELVSKLQSLEPQLAELDCQLDSVYRSIKSGDSVALTKVGTKKSSKAKAKTNPKVNPKKSNTQKTKTQKNKTQTTAVKVATTVAAKLGSRSETPSRAPEKLLRINADRLTKLMGLSSELLIETQRIRPVSNAMQQLRKRYGEVSTVMDKLRDGLQVDRVSERNMALLLEAQMKLIECRNTLSERIEDLEEFDRKSGYLSSRVYNELVSTRMRPFSDSVQGLERTARDLARSLGKKVKLTIQGLDTPVDREILEKIKSPLTHLVRNAIDHGIEHPQDRQQKNKNSEGKVNIKAGHIGAVLHVSVEDDGQGVDLSLLKQNILSKGLSSGEILEEMSEAELYEFMYLPNFSTRGEVTEISGRGVGLDVVRAIIHDLKGTLATTSVTDKGMKVSIQIPLTKSVISAVVAEIAGELYAFPLSRVTRLMTVAATELKTQEGRQCVMLNDQVIDVVPASAVLELDSTFYGSDDLHIVVIGQGHNLYGVLVERLLGQKELSVQNLDPCLGKIQDVTAAALSEQGRPILIIDMDDFFRSTEVTIHRASGAPFSVEKYSSYLPARKRILFVDDSLTVRELVKNLLIAVGYEVELAVDGVDGWNTLRRSRFDLVITDVDMPRMDGIELVQSLKADTRLQKIPVMIISYKDRSEDRVRGLQAGADYYIAKGSFQDKLLIEAVKDLIGAPVGL
ncbi:MAG: response regulator [Gammaproteobacteria bacterium]|nr:response regulator [Gammaproteobacteria bacterium]MDH5801356.1 response regulator [Gammaproteobacteria bacterium]